MSYREPPGYIDNLLALRGLCAFGVAFVHFSAYSDLSYRWYLENAWEFGAASKAFLSAIAPVSGKNFVLFFFVHAGYLMGKVFFTGRYSLDRSGIGSFYRGRLLRIAPLLYVNLVACLLILPQASPTWTEALGDFLFVNNFTGRGINGVTWSLSWEMQYYLVAPLVFMFFAAPSKRALLSLIALAFLFEILSIAGIRDIPPIEFYFYFLLGFAVNHALRHFGHRTFRGATALAVIGGFFIANALYFVLHNAGLERVAANPFIGIASALTIYLLELPRADDSASAPEKSYGPLRRRFLRFWTWMGILSYGIYLWHLPILLLLGPHLVETAEGLMAAVGGVEAGWARMMLFHAVQGSIGLGLTVLLSLFTFFVVELRFRPHLYQWDKSQNQGVLRPLLGKLQASLGFRQSR